MEEKRKRLDNAINKFFLDISLGLQEMDAALRDASVPFAVDITDRKKAGLKKNIEKQQKTVKKTDVISDALIRAARTIKKPTEANILDHVRHELSNCHTRTIRQLLKKLIAEGRISVSSPK